MFVTIIITIQLEEIISEINERNLRKKNVIFFNVGEQSSTLSKDDRINKERSDISEIVNTICPEIHTDNISFHRLGKFNANSNKPRPIKITFPNQDPVHKLIKNASKLKQNNTFKKVSIVFDRTPKQTSYYQELKQQLADREERGEQNLKIKYVQGMPKIVSLNQ